ncbi:MAG: preprotein translocase subunit YajC [Bacteroidetes bacterium HGW-Bacteroidetes-6]|jgi:preprotein translocase subunit YajC|nr:MAG: preprotein translocase subunit YajC [Bacteroidetes bacterium HGW-Bacteroidetes-6]
MNLAYILLMQPSGGEEGGSGGYTTMIMLLLLVVVFWLFFIRPQSRKNKEINKFRQNLKKGDRVITIGGIHGKIIEVVDTAVIIETEGQGKLKLEKSAIASEFNPEAMTEKK